VYRLFLTWLLIGTCSPLLAADTSASGKPYVVSYRFSLLKKENCVWTRAGKARGKTGTPLNCSFDGPNNLVLQLDVRDTSSTQSTFYRAGFKLLEATKDKKQRVVHHSTIAARPDVPARMTSGNRDGDRVEVELAVNERMTLATAPKSTTSSNLGTSMMQMANPRIIITGEEEERIGVVPPKKVR
jgi:hypothetical protein